MLPGLVGEPARNEGAERGEQRTICRLAMSVSIRRFGATHYRAWVPAILQLRASSCPDGSHLPQRIPPNLTVLIFSRMLHAPSIDPLGVVEDPIHAPRRHGRRRAAGAGSFRWWVRVGSDCSTPEGLNRPCSSRALQCPSDCPGQMVHLWPRRLTAWEGSPANGQAPANNATGGPLQNISIFPGWSLLAILLAPRE